MTGRAAAGRAPPTLSRPTAIREASFTGRLPDCCLSCGLAGRAAGERQDLPPVDPPEKHGADAHGGRLRDGVGPPHQVQLSGQAQKIGGRKQNDHLPGDGDQHGVQSVSQRLEKGAADNAVGRGNKAQRDDAQGGFSHLQHGCGGVKQLQQRAREHVENQRSRAHDAHRVNHAQLHRPQDPFLVPGAEVIGHDGHESVVQPEHRHENKALKLEINTEYRGGGGGKSDQDAIHAVDHDGADGLHDDAGQAHEIDAPDNLPVRPEAPEAQRHLRIFPQAEQQRQQRSHDLSRYRGDGGARHLQPRKAQQPEDQDGVEDQVDDRADGLGDHGVDRAPGGLKQPLERDPEKQPRRHTAADGQILGAVAEDLLHAGLGAIEGPDQRRADSHEGQKAQRGQKDAVDGGAPGALKVFFSQRPGEQGVDAHAGARRHGDHQRLDRKGERDGGQGVFREHGDENAVHNVVKSLHQHGDHHGQGHIDQQPVDGHIAHFVPLRRFRRLWSLIHWRAVPPYRSVFSLCREKARRGARLFRRNRIRRGSGGHISGLSAAFFTSADRPWPAASGRR